MEQGIQCSRVIIQHVSQTQFVHKHVLEGTGKSLSGLAGEK